MSFWLVEIGRFSGESADSVFDSLGPFVIMDLALTDSGPIRPDSGFMGESIRESMQCFLGRFLESDC